APPPASARASWRRSTTTRSGCARAGGARSSPCRRRTGRRSRRAGSSEAIEQPSALVVAEPAEPAALADVELLHHAARLDLAHARQRFEHAHDLELRDRLVAVTRVEELLERETARLQALLHGGALTPRLRGLLECGAALFRA